MGAFLGGLGQPRVADVFSGDYLVADDDASQILQAADILSYIVVDNMRSRIEKDRGAQNAEECFESFFADADEGGRGRMREDESGLRDALAHFCAEDHAENQRALTDRLVQFGQHRTLRSLIGVVNTIRPRPTSEITPNKRLPKLMQYRSLSSLSSSRKEDVGARTVKLIDMLTAGFSTPLVYYTIVQLEEMFPKCIASTFDRDTAETILAHVEETAMSMRDDKDNEALFAGVEKGLAAENNETRGGKLSRRNRMYALVCTGICVVNALVASIL